MANVLKNRRGRVKVFAILVGTGVATLNVAVAVWNNHNLFFNLKTVNNGIGIDRCRYRFVVAVFAVADCFSKPWYGPYKVSLFCAHISFIDFMLLLKFLVIFFLHKIRLFCKNWESWIYSPETSKSMASPMSSSLALVICLTKSHWMLILLATSLS